VTSALRAERLKFSAFLNYKFMPRFEMPEDTSRKSEYAGKEAEYDNKSVMLTDEGRKVVILNYQKSEGLYAVMNLDEAGTRSPAYRISPDKLRKIEAEKSEEATGEERERKRLSL